MCTNCVHFLIYTFDGSQTQSISGSFFNSIRGKEKVVLKVVTGKLTGHIGQSKAETDRLASHQRKAEKLGFQNPLERMQYHLFWERGTTEERQAKWDDSEWYYQNINEQIGTFVDPYDWDNYNKQYALIINIEDFSVEPEKKSRAYQVVC